jgi:hypothetical protein
MQLGHERNQEVYSESHSTIKHENIKIDSTLQL